jgi:glycosyltransferase involved in cell wall biosynthesis
VSTAPATKIHFAYRHVDKPWGGANNFIRALHAYLQRQGRFTFTAAIDEDCDVLFMNQLGRGPGDPGRPWKISEIEPLLRQNAAGRRRKLVVRAVNLNRHAFRAGPRNFLFGFWQDRATVKLLNLADVAIFQSEYQRSFFVDGGYRGRNSVVIHNGADQRFSIDPQRPALGETLRFVSSSASPRESKRHYVLARLSRVAGVEVVHLGAWPTGLDVGNVRCLGMQPPEQMLSALTQAHYFVHPAVKDPCPNSIFEAICAGLPVIYNPAPGSSAEIVGECGFPLDEDRLEDTVARARANFAELSAAVVRLRHRYGIEHAAARYMQVFDSVRPSEQP